MFHQSQTSQVRKAFQKESQSKQNPYVRVIDGVTYIDAEALELSISKDLPVKDHLR